MSSELEAAFARALRQIDAMHKRLSREQRRCFSKLQCGDLLYTQCMTAPVEDSAYRATLPADQMERNMFWMRRRIEIVDKTDIFRRMIKCRNAFDRAKKQQQERADRLFLRVTPTMKSNSHDSSRRGSSRPRSRAFKSASKHRESLGDRVRSVGVTRRSLRSLRRRVTVLHRFRFSDHK